MDLAFSSSSMLSTAISWLVGTPSSPPHQKSAASFAGGLDIRPVAEKSDAPVPTLEKMTVALRHHLHCHHDNICFDAGGLPVDEDNRGPACIS
jgi:hypothetical protein